MTTVNSPVAVQETYYTIPELASRWRVSHRTVLKIIENYPVMSFRHPSSTAKRNYVVRRVPASTVQLVEQNTTSKAT